MRFGVALFFLSQRRRGAKGVALFFFDRINRIDGEKF